MYDLLGGVAGDSIKLFALMTPTAVLSAFLGYTRQCATRRKLAIALKSSLAIFILGAILYIWGSSIFELFGFTLDAFRIGAGVLLMLNSIALMRDDGNGKQEKMEGDISVVPLAIPMGLGPASIGAIMVMGAQAETFPQMWLGLISLFVAAFCMFLLLGMADLFGKMLQETGIAVLSKLTGLILAAIAAQVAFSGAVNFLNSP